MFDYLIVGSGLYGAVFAQQAGEGGWRKGILSSFKYGYTNGSSEDCNNKIKALNRNAYDYRNFKMLQNQILYMFYWRNNEQNVA